MATDLHTDAELQQLKKNAEFILDSIDGVSDKSGISYWLLFTSMLFVCAASYVQLTTFIWIYTGLAFIGSIMAGVIMSDLMNVYRIHIVLPRIYKSDSGQEFMQKMYQSMIGNYKSVGIIVFTTIVECWFIVEYTNDVLLAGMWAIVCLIIPIVVIRLHKTYDKIIKVHEYAVQNS